MAKRNRGKQRQINLELNEGELLREWKKRVGIELYKFASRNFPLKRKMTGKDLYVDSDGNCPKRSGHKRIQCTCEPESPRETSRRQRVWEMENCIHENESWKHGDI